MLLSKIGAYFPDFCFGLSFGFDFYLIFNFVHLFFYVLVGSDCNDLYVFLCTLDCNCKVDLNSLFGSSLNLLLNDEQIGFYFLSLVACFHLIAIDLSFIFYQNFPLHHQNP